MRIGNSQQRVDPKLTQPVGPHKAEAKQKTSGTKQLAPSQAGGDVDKLLSKLRATAEDRTALVDAVKQRLGQGEYVGSESAKATAQAIIDQLGFR